MLKKGYRNEILILSVLFVAILLFSCSRENSDWETAKITNTEAAYKSFVAKYPDGKHTNEAINAKEKLAWETTKKANTIVSVESFIASYPKSSFLAEAQQLLKKLSEFTGVKADCLIHFGFNKNWEGRALMEGSISYAISGDMTTLGAPTPGGTNKVVIFGNLSENDALNASKLGAKKNTVYMISDDLKLKFLGNIDENMDPFKVEQMCGFANAEGSNFVSYATESITWDQFFQYLKPKQ